MAEFSDRGFGWLRDLADPRDRTVESASVASLLAPHRFLGVAPEPALPPSVDNRRYCSEVVDQKNLGSCTANAGTGALEYCEMKAFGKHTDGSRLFLYKTTRALARLKGDSGAYLRDTMKAMALYGVPPESEWPYEIASFDAEPPQSVYALAQNYQALEYFRLDPAGQAPEATLAAIKKAIAGGLPVMFGTAVYDSFPMSAGSGDVPVPAAGEGLRGGHAMLKVGYDDARPCLNSRTLGAFLIRNSWGVGWGYKGYGWLPYYYVTHGFASDFWSLSRAEYIDSDLFD